MEAHLKRNKKELTFPCKNWARRAHWPVDFSLKYQIELYFSFIVGPLTTFCTVCIIILHVLYLKYAYLHNL